MSTEDLEYDYDDEMYTDTSMFDADEIVRSVEEVARSKAEADGNLSARRRFEMMLEHRRLAEDLGETFDEDDWDSDDWSDDWS